MSDPKTVSGDQRIMTWLAAAAFICGRCTLGPEVAAVEDADVPVAAAAPPIGDTVATSDAFSTCTAVATVDSAVLAVGGGDPAALARMAGCSALTELRVVDLSTPPNAPQPLLHLDLTPLAKVRSLGTLELGSCRCDGWDALATLPHLRELRVGDLAGPSDIDAIGRLVGLERLVLAGRAPGGIAPLSRLVGLSSLVLHDPQITDLTPLAELTALRELSMFNLAATDLTPVSHLGLHLLEVNGSTLSTLATLSTGTLIPALRVLKLVRTSVMELSPLARCEKLTRLDLDDTPVRSIVALSRLQNLSYLSIANTRITDISPISDLQALDFLDVSGLDIEAAQLRALRSRVRIVGVASRPGQQ